MPQLVESPVRVPVPGGKLIDEYVGRASTASEQVSVAHMRSPAGWEEPAQTPEFDEVTLVLGGAVHVEHDGGTLVVAAVYELTPLKDVCLGKCRSPLGTLLGSWRDGLSGALHMGTRNGAWCVGCCWALMASLFALGIMSVVWMAVIAGIIALEKTIPWRRVATYGTAAVLLRSLRLMV